MTGITNTPVKKNRPVRIEKCPVCGRCRNISTSKPEYWYYMINGVVVPNNAKLHKCMICDSIFYRYTNNPVIIIKWKASVCVKIGDI